jgi:hypothetical protein
MSAISIVSEFRERPKFIIVHGPEGVGKTSLPAFAPKPVYLQVGDERGLETLVNANQLPKTPYFKGDCNTYPCVLERLTWLLENDHDRQTLVLDTMNGIEGLCHELVVERDYNGDNTKTGFLDYYVGYKTALTDWRKLLKLIDRLRIEKKMAVIGLCHTMKRTFSNPEGKDYDRYEPAFAARDTWAITHRAADAVLYMTFYTTVTQGDVSDSRSTKGKASGGQSRVIYTERTATYDAKNRFGLPEDIEADGGGQVAWNNLTAAFTTARNGKES